MLLDSKLFVTSTLFNPERINSAHNDGLILTVHVVPKKLPVYLRQIKNID